MGDGSNDERGAGAVKIKNNKLPKTRSECWHKGYEAGAIAVTKLLDEHPEDWNGPCMCATCMDYGSQG